MNDSPNNQPSLVSVDWLARHLDPATAPPVAVLDASFHLPATGRDARAEFEAAHIPGAQFLDLANLVDKTSSVPAALPRPDQCAEQLAALGVAPGTTIVLYDDSAVKSSARAWFALRALGWPRLAVLDGGLSAWRAADQPCANGASEPEPAPPAALGPAQRVASKADMLRVIDDKSAQIVDARSAARVFGTGEDPVHGGQNGRIPGSFNVPYETVFNADGTYRSLRALETAFHNSGLDLDRPIIASCGSGVTASVLLFALHLIGVPEALLYDGSWSEWGADPTTPKEVGHA
jgi:thiosulfate/3-mercaptopyruvate sulfurtransferase